MPGPGDFAHGHGLAARTRVNRAGKTACVPARAITTSPDSSGWRSASRTSRWNSGASSRKRIPRCARLRGARADDTPLPPPTMAAIDDVWCGAQNGGTRQQPGARRQAPGDRVDRGDLERRRRLQRRQDRRQPLGQHRLARSGRAEQGQVMPAGRADLRRQPRLRLAEHLRQVQFLGQCEARVAGAGPAAARERRRSAGGGPPRSQTITSVRLLAPTTWTPGTRAASATFCAATTTVSDARLGRDHRGQYPGHRAQPPVQAQFGQEHLPGQRGRRHRLGRGEDGHRDGQVKARCRAWAARRARGRR